MTLDLSGLIANNHFSGKWMILEDFLGGKLVYAQVASVDEARIIWTRIAQAVGMTCCLISFTVVENMHKVDGGEVLYRGNYATDEC